MIQLQICSSEKSQRRTSQASVIFLGEKVERLLRWSIAGSFDFFFRLASQPFIIVFSAYFSVFCSSMRSTIRKPFSFTCSYWPTELSCAWRCTLSRLWDDACLEGRQLCQYLTRERERGRERRRWLPAFTRRKKKKLVEISRALLSATLYVGFYNSPYNLPRWIRTTLLHTIYRRSQSAISQFVLIWISCLSSRRRYGRVNARAIMYDRHRWFRRRWRKSSSLSTFPTHQRKRNSESDRNPTRWK